MLLIETLKNSQKNKTPVWFMRQAGRYLPEYRKIREKSQNFLKMCYSPEIVVELTMQPIIRFDLDAAIIFSDILVIHDILGFKVDFIENKGPVVMHNFEFSNLKHSNADFNGNNIQNVYKAIKETRKILSQNKALIGFVGAPWTLACYACEQGSSKDFLKTKIFSLNNTQEFDHLIQIFTQVTISHLLKQIEAGVNAVQIFDTWSNILDENDYIKYVLKPFVEIASAIKIQHPEIPIIWFPRGSFGHYNKFFKNNFKEIQSLFNCLSVDYFTSLTEVLQCTKDNIVIQGNLDPTLLLIDNFSIIESKILKILNDLKGRANIFNLGHGMLPPSKIENIVRLLEVIKNFDIKNGFQ